MPGSTTRWTRASAEHLGAYGLSVGQFDVLAQVGAREGITQKELAEKLLVTKSNVCQIVRRMQERGLVSRHQEGRAKRLFLAQEGRRLFEEELIDRLLSCYRQKTTTYSRKSSAG